MIEYGVVALGLGFYLGYWLRSQSVKRDANRLTSFYESLLAAELIQQHIYLDPPATIYAAVSDKLAYIGQTTQPWQKRIAQHEKGTTAFDRVYGRDPSKWMWIVLEVVPTTYRFAAEKAWIAEYKRNGHMLMNANYGTDDGLTWTIRDDNSMVP